jgi:hypothetical protein
VRDIDDWVFEFERAVASRLKKLFEQDLHETPEKLLEQVERLRLAEEKRMKNGPK